MPGLECSTGPKSCLILAPFTKSDKVTTQPKYRISGHESFSCRYSWLPKAVRSLARDSGLFSNEEHAMVELGVGKNMVRAIRFWAQVTGMVTTTPKTRGHSLTDLGITLLSEDGLDPFLEDIRTLWLLHWNLSTDVTNPLLAWDFLLNRWQEPEFTRRDGIKVLDREAAKFEKVLSPVTIADHFGVFLHTYVAWRQSSVEGSGRRPMWARSAKNFWPGE
jgi:hypothetical protein